MASWVDDFGQKLVNVHEEGTCWGKFCTIHNPSDHPLSLMPQRWSDYTMCRVCTHGVAHIDMDDHNRRDGCVLECDKCCEGAEND